MKSRSGTKLAIGSHRWPYIISGVVGIFVAVTVVAPMMLLLVRTFLPAAGGGFTLQVYVDAFTGQRTLTALGNTLILVAGSTALAVGTGVALAWVIARTDVPFRRVLNLVPIMPLFFPPVVGAVSWVFLLGENAGLVNVFLRNALPGLWASGPFNIFSLTGMIWVTGLYITPYVYLIVLVAFRKYDTSLDEAALISGVRARSILRGITLPVLTPAIFAGALLAMVTAMAQFAIPAILGGPAQIPVLTTEIYNNLRRHPRNVEEAAALAVITVAITIVALYLQRRMLRGKDRFVTIGGKGSRQTRTKLGRWRWPVLVGVAGYVVVSVVAPLIALLNVSFRSYWSATLSLDGLTLANYDYIVNHYALTWTSIRTSVVLATVGATIGMALAAMISYTVVKSRIRGRGVIDYVATLPVAVPATVLGAGLLLLFLEPPFALYGTTVLLVMAYVANFLPHGVRTSNASFHQVASELEQSALVCGNSWPGTFRTITMPLVSPALAGGWVFLFILMSRELSASALLASPRTTVMSVVVLDLWNSGAFPRLATFSMIVLAVSTLMTIVSLRVGNRGTVAA